MTTKSSPVLCDSGVSGTAITSGIFIVSIFGFFFSVQTLGDAALFGGGLFRWSASFGFFWEHCGSLSGCDCDGLSLFGMCRIAFELELGSSSRSLFSVFFLFVVFCFFVFSCSSEGLVLLFAGIVCMLRRDLITGSRHAKIAMSDLRRLVSGFGLVAR